MVGSAPYTAVYNKFIISALKACFNRKNSVGIIFHNRVLNNLCAIGHKAQRIKITHGNIRLNTEFFQMIYSRVRRYN